MDDKLGLVECQHCGVVNVVIKDKIEDKICTLCKKPVVSSSYKAVKEDKEPQIELNLGSSLLGGY